MTRNRPCVGTERRGMHQCRAKEQMGGGLVGSLSESVPAHPSLVDESRGGVVALESIHDDRLGQEGGLGVPPACGVRRACDPMVKIEMN